MDTHTHIYLSIQTQGIVNMKAGFSKTRCEVEKDVPKIRDTAGTQKSFPIIIRTWV